MDVLSLHDIAGDLRAGALGGGRGEEAHVDVLVLHELLEGRQDVALDQLLALGRALGRTGAAFLLELRQGSRAVVGDAAEDVNQDSVGLGDVEADVRNGVADELLENGEDGAGEDWEGERRGKSLVTKLAKSLEVCFLKCRLTDTAKQVVIL